MPLTIAAGASVANAAPPWAGLTGVWESEGYGLVVKVDEQARLEFFHHHDKRCQPDTGTPVAAELAQLEWAKLSDDGQRLVAFSRENITRFRFRRLPSLEAVCESNLVETQEPVANFEFAWSLMETHYAFFSERHVDWYRLHQRYRPRVTALTSPTQLFDILSQLLGEVEDRHITLEADAELGFRSGLGPVISPWLPDRGARSGSHASQFKRVLERLQPYKDLVERRYLLSKVARGANGEVSWGLLRGGIGYLRVDSFGDFAESDVLADRRAALDSAIETMLQELKGMRSLVLDLRFNLGGNDRLGLALASRFTRQRHPAYEKSARTSDGFSDPQPLAVEPAAGTFTGPVAVLIGNITVSAGENFVLATLGFPNFVRIGEKTAGAMSDVLYKRLPNGWLLGLSNEVFRSASGQLFEGRGIPADIEVPNHFGGSTLARRIDPVLERALVELSKRAPASDDARSR